MLRAVCQKDLEWTRAFNDTLKVFSNQADEVKEQCILNLLQLGASLGDLEWDGAGDLIHRPTGFGYHFTLECGDGWLQYNAEPVVKEKH